MGPKIDVLMSNLDDAIVRYVRAALVMHNSPKTPPDVYSSDEASFDEARTELRRACGAIGNTFDDLESRVRYLEQYR